MRGDDVAGIAVHLAQRLPPWPIPARCSSPAPSPTSSPAPAFSSTIGESMNSKASPEPGICIRSC